MNETEILERLGAAARGSVAPDIDPARDVLASIRRRSVVPAPTKFCWAFVAVSSAAASVMVALAIRAWSQWQDPINDLFSICDMVIR